MTDKSTCLECGAVQGEHHTDECSIVGVVGVEDSPEDRATMQRDFERSIYEQNPPGDGTEQSSAGESVPITIAGNKTEALDLGQTLRAAGPDAQRDWTEDFPHENGRYQCHCVECGLMFYGHKRRHICKLCANEDAQPTPKTDAQQKAADEAFDVAGLVPASFARELERALAQCRDQLAAANARAANAYQMFMDLGIARQQLEAERAAREAAEHQLKDAIEIRNVVQDARVRENKAAESRLATVEARLRWNYDATMSQMVNPQMTYEHWQELIDDELPAKDKP